MGGGGEERERERDVKGVAVEGKKIRLPSAAMFMRSMHTLLFIFEMHFL